MPSAEGKQKLRITRKIHIWILHLKAFCRKPHFEGITESDANVTA
jgi:hypothetical protein